MEPHSLRATQWWQLFTDLHRKNPKTAAEPFQRLSLSLSASTKKVIYMSGLPAKSQAALRPEDRGDKPRSHLLLCSAHVCMQILCYKLLNESRLVAAAHLE